VVGSKPSQKQQTSKTIGQQSGSKWQLSQATVNMCACAHNLSVAFTWLPSCQPPTVASALGIENDTIDAWLVIALVSSGNLASLIAAACVGFSPYLNITVAGSPHSLNTKATLNMSALSDSGSQYRPQTSV